MKKIKKMELGEAEDKSDSVLLHDKTHCRTIILEYSFEELEKIIAKELD